MTKLPVTGVLVAAGRVIQLWRGLLPAVLQHVIWKVCQQLVQLKKKKIHENDSLRLLGNRVILRKCHKFS